MVALLPEILEEIFLHLHQNDKVECRFVCHQWKEIIDRYALYHTLYINSGEDQDKLVEIIQKQPSIANKVERLIVCISDRESCKNLNTVLLLLPNIKAFYYSGLTSTLSTLENKVDYPWKSSIREIVDLSSDGPSFNILSSSTYSKLTTLRVVFRTEYVLLFKNVSALTTLDLMRFDGAFSELETLHNSLPHLKLFKIRGGTISDSGFNAKSIKPANSVVKCLFDFYIIRPDTIEAKINLLNYICKKYPNLSALTYTNRQPTTGDNAQKLNNLGWRPLFNTLGVKLKRLVIIQGGYNNVLLELLDQCNCQINHVKLGYLPFSMLTNIGQSLQTNYIQTFEYSLIRGDILGDFDWLNKFERLKKLKLSYCNKGIGFNLNDVLDNSPSTLETLSLNWIVCDINLRRINLCTIKTLSLNSVTLPEKMDTFISQCFPKLSKLKLKHCGGLESTWHLKNVNLFEFHFAGYFENGNPMVSIVCNKEQRWFTYNEKVSRRLEYMNCKVIYGLPLLLPFKSSIENKISAFPDFTLICNSVKSVIFTI
ncbi:hypothetical protein K501DRAFT_278851 [Backusella circina FSU 941]|nr:hypothetical protein K501DRAFT_278851 [Backusella circina FSU 941]